MMEWSLKSFREVIRPVRRQAGVLFWVMVAGSVFDMLGIGLVLPLFDLMLSPDKTRNPLIQVVRRLGYDPWWDLAVVGGLTLGAFTAKFLFVSLRAYVAADFVNSLRQFWTSRIFENFIFSDYKYLKRQRLGELTNTMAQEPLFASKGISDVVDIAVNALIALTMVIVMALADWKLMLAIIIVLIGCAFGVWSASTRHSSGIGKERIRQNQEISQLVMESVNGARQIKVFSVEKRALSELNERLEKLMNALRRFAMTNALPPAFSEFFIVLVFVSGLLVQNYWLKVNLSDLLATASVFALAGMRLFNASSTLFAKRMAVIAYWPSIAVVHAHATRGAGGHEISDKGARLTDPVRCLSVDNLTFSFDAGEPLFEGLNLEAGLGLFAFAGKSGSGKSTLCDLVAKLYTPEGGRIVANEIDLAEISTASWRSKLGYVSQDNFMFHASIAENIAVGAPGADRESVREAARMADATAFIDALPDGYDTVIGQGGISLSGGQRQRIAIARALIRKPDVIIFDEATSALDAESEVKILNELKKLAVNSIVLVTTHRLRTLAVADRIFWFESGRLIESGSYAELIKVQGKFASLATAGA